MKIPRVQLWRILGNDLPPRHSTTQTRENLKHILLHEPSPPWIEKIFLLNRVVDPDAFQALRALLADAGARSLVIPFEAEVYCGFNSKRERAHYLTNINRARNYCIERAFSSGAHIALPFDGACCFNEQGIAFFETELERHAATKQRLPQLCGFPIVRLIDNSRYQGFKIDDFPPRTHIENGVAHISEPQLGFTVDAPSPLRFDEARPWGDADKAELLVRLGFRGVWNDWIAGGKPPSEDLPLLSYVCRLASGNVRAENDVTLRAVSRRIGLRRLVKHADRYSLYLRMRAALQSQQWQQGRSRSACAVERENASVLLYRTPCPTPTTLRELRKIAGEGFGKGNTFLLLDRAASAGVSVDSHLVVTFDSTKLAGLGHPTPSNERTKAHTHLPVLGFYLEHPHYDYYWIVEDSVRFTGHWDLFFRSFADTSEGLLSCHIRRKSDEPDWPWWSSLSHPRRVMAQDRLVRSFNVVYRLSRNALRLIHESHLDGWIGHPETLVATLIHAAGLGIADFGGNGEFVRSGFQNHFYTSHAAPDGSLMNGTVRFRPSRWNAGRWANTLYHPVQAPDDADQVTRRRALELSVSDVMSGLAFRARRRLSNIRRRGTSDSLKR